MLKNDRTEHSLQAENVNFTVLSRSACAYDRKGPFLSPAKHDGKTDGKPLLVVASATSYYLYAGKIHFSSQTAYPLHRLKLLSCNNKSMLFVEYPGQQIYQNAN